MIDAGSLFYTLLTRDTTMKVAHEVDVDTIDNLPTCTYNWSGSGQTANGDDLWEGFLDLNLFDLRESAFDNASALYDLVHAWPTGAVTEFGWVTLVTDQSMFSLVPDPAVAGRQVVQYAGSFA